MRGVYICVSVSDWKGHMGAEIEVGGGVCVYVLVSGRDICVRRERGRGGVFMLVIGRNIT